MDPAVMGTRLASSAVAPLVKRLFVREGPGAGLVEKPVRLSSLVSFKGEKRTLGRRDVRRLAERLVAASLSAPGERSFPPDEAEAVTDALTRALLSLGDLDMDDVQAVRLGHRELARTLIGGASASGLSADAALYLDSVTEWACLHILQFFTQRSTFVAATLVAQSRGQDELIAKVDELIARRPTAGAQDVTFERRYLAYVAKKHSKLTIFGIDLTGSPGKWPLDAAYMSLEAVEPGRVATARFLSGAEYHAEEVEIVEHAPPVPADQALATHDRVLLRGEAGSGKTTLVQWLAVSATRRDVAGPAPSSTHPSMAYLDDHVPYVLPLRTLTRHGERLPAPADFLTAVGCPLAGTQPKGWEARVLAAGRALVLIDGIDEIPDAERDRTRAWLSDLIDAFPGNRWLVTSRPAAVREDWLTDEGFTELTLSAMRQEEVTAFIQRWHTAATTGVPEEDAELAAYEGQLLDAVRSKPDLGRLATNPLMCGLICALHRDRRGFLPLGRKDLYTAALSMLLVRRDRERHMAVPELREEPQLQLLQRLAYWLIRNGRTEMDRSRAEAIIADALPAVPELAPLGDARAVYTHFLHRSGLLREPGPGTVDFVHRTFQDFLGARAAVDEGDFGVLARHAADDQWEDVIRMAVAQARPRERAEILGDLLAHGDRHPDEAARKRIHLLAAACLEHAAELAPAVREEVERRTAALIPPRDVTDAKALAKVGPMVLDLLPGPDGLSDDEATHVTITGTRVDSDAAIPFLARFARHRSLGVRSQLMWGWQRYDRRAYAEQIIARLDGTDIHFTLRTDEQIAELDRLGLRPRKLDIRPGVTPAVASRFIAACEPTFLLLNRFPPALLTPEALRALDQLDGLSVVGAYEPWSLAPFPAEAPLKFLGLVGSRASLTDLHLATRWPALERVTFDDDDVLSATDWEVFAALPGPLALHLPTHALTLAPPDLALPGLADLQLVPDASWTVAASRIAALAPRLKRLFLQNRPEGTPDRHAPVDVSALAHHPSLTELTVPAVAVGLDAMPAHIDVQVYGSLTD
ncbi:MULTISPECIES: NACHT domain-containing protein [unclassified Streptomyces]|uniref:NACHT domain-containing protein n=1 Tax=unclassified Streptomyces TaxID=2593676 RepID=UPI00137222FE|nr:MULTISPECIES: NACHT domain-containing protein [unclassified Streptomyces]NEA00698.1 NACHT domain-containing protein [Streptomyces sp. SID10116]MYY84730.1 NACHT domain-containing protein [Streptomyces sp. SID335]MYZ11876.1 NACHT domain-containing protein [Streptomyces sp. SID337]NDZ89883.1 NACHT domain-containing protein [Streptomyces sp. SID10115]NEB49313.1 NACHT domain-containing protein [Streptomyces sp. SID339]